MVGVKQQRLIDIGKARGQLNISDVRKLYPQIEFAKSAMVGLEIRGYFQKYVIDGNYIWKYIGGEERDVESDVKEVTAEIKHAKLSFTLSEIKEFVKHKRSMDTFNNELAKMGGPKDES